jgi:hypothetical protein
MRLPAAYVRCIGKRTGEFLVVLDLEALIRIPPEQDAAHAP